MREVTDEEFDRILDVALAESDAGKLSDEGLYRRIMQLVEALPEVH